MEWTINYKLMDDPNANDKASIVVTDIVNEFERLIPDGLPLAFGKGLL